MPVRPVILPKPFTPENIRDLIVSIIGEADYEEDIDDSDDDVDF